MRKTHELEAGVPCKGARVAQPPCRNLETFRGAGPLSSEHMLGWMNSLFHGFM